MKKIYIEILELILERVDSRLDDTLINLRFDVKQMLLRLKKQKTKITNQQVQDITDFKLRLNKELKGV